MGRTTYPLKASPDSRTFHFISSGPNGHIQKRVEFQSLRSTFEGQAVFNLGFGDVREDGSIDDTVASNNGDIVRIMATVLGSVYEFSSEYPEHCVYFHGSDNQRTAFYRAIIQRHYAMLAGDFEIFGVTRTINALEVEAFDDGRRYDAFLVRRKLKDAE